MAIKPPRKIFIFLFFLLLIGFTYILGTMPDTRSAAQAAHCFYNLERISGAIQEYKKDNNGRYPDTLKELFPKYLDLEFYFECQATKTKGDPSNPPYLYIKPVPNATSDTVMLIDDNHSDCKIIGYKGGYARITRNTRQILAENAVILMSGLWLLTIYLPWGMPLLFFMIVSRFGSINRASDLVRWWILTSCLMCLIVFEFLIWGWWFVMLRVMGLYSTVSCTIALGLNVAAIFVLVRKLKKSKNIK